MFYLVRVLVVYRKVDKNLYFALASFLSALYIYCQYQLGFPAETSTLLMYHRIKLLSSLYEAFLMLMIGYDLVNQKATIPRVFLIIVIVITFFSFTNWFVGSPVTHLSVNALGLEFNYRYGVTGVVYRFMSMVVLVTLIAAIIQVVNHGATNWKRKLAFFLMFGPVIPAAINDYLVAQQVIQGIMLTEYTIVITMGVVFAILYGEEQANYLSLKNMNRLLEEKVVARTRELETQMTRTDQLNQDLSSTNLNLKRINKMLEMDISMAWNVQAAFLPSAPDLPDWDIDVIYRPMAGVSGDFYDFYIRGNRLEGMAVFDVSGHGVASALVTLLAKSMLFRLFSRFKGLPLGEVISRFNHELLEELGDADNFLTGILISLLDNGRAEFVNAGHSPILIKDSKGEVSIVCAGQDEDRGPCLGIPGVNARYRECSFTFDSGDTLLIFTDGLVETRNSEAGMFGVDRLMKTWSSQPTGLTAAQQNQALLEVLNVFSGKKEFDDDLTMVIVHKK